MEAKNGVTEDVIISASNKKSTLAWGGCGQGVSAPCSLEAVMSETLAQELADQVEHTSSCLIQDPAVDYDITGWMSSDDIDTSSDLLLAQMLQLELDAEHDRQLKREEDKWNGSSKVKITYDKYRTVHPALQADTDCDYEEVIEAKEKKDSTPQFNRSGICGKGKNIVTKHDATICGRKNAMKVMENFPPEFETGDGGTFDMRLPNNVFNQLKNHSKVENKRSHRLHEKKEHATVEQAVDAKTRLIMYKLVNGGTLDAINGVISCGKESVIFHAYGGSVQNQVVPAECVLKVFKTTLAEFRNRCQYICGDVRFFKDEFKKQNPRKIMKIWAEKEMINLRKMEKFGIPCPSVVVLKKHVLVMSFIGQQQNAAPKLKDARMSAAEYQLAYEQCVQYVKKLYVECQLVHSDLSEYNLLWWNDQVYVIDVAQAVDAMHPRAMNFLLRDCKNISEFFTKRGVTGVGDEYSLFNHVTGLELQGEGQEFLAQIEKYEKDERVLQLGQTSTDDYPFEYFFTRACDSAAVATASATVGASTTTTVETSSDESASESDDETVNTT